MSRKIVVIIALLLSTGLVAQITKLSSLSSSKFLGSAVVLEDNNEDVYGYFILYEKNRPSKIELELEYVLLDKNMNKVHQAVFKHGAQNFGPYKITCYLENIKKIKENLYITIAYRSNYGALNTNGKIQDFRKLNLNDFTLSDTHKLSAKGERVIEPLYDKKMKEFYDVTLIEPTTYGSGFIAGGDLKDTSYSKDNQFSYYDLDLTKKWTYKFNEKDDKPATFYFFKEDGNDLVFFKRYIKKASDFTTIDLSIQLIDKQTGKNKFEIPLKDTEHIYVYERLFFQEDKIVLIASVFKYKDKREYDDKDRLGFARITYDRTTGAQKGKEFLKWTDLSQKFSIDEKGNIKDYGKLHFLDYKLLSDGKLLIAAEGHSMGHSARTFDMFMFVFDDKMKIADFKKVDKMAWEMDLVPNSSQNIENVGAFDYMYSQKISQDEFVFYYKNRIKEKGQKPRWDLGVITYTAGKFDNSSIPLKTSNSKIIPLPAKKGYILFKEIPEEKGKDDDIEETFRLEKVNY